MDVIPVETYPLTATLGTPTAAIAYAQSYPPLARAKRDAILLKGSSLMDASWTDQDLVLRTSNDLFLRIEVTDRGSTPRVSWILNPQPPTDPEVRKMVGAERCMLAWSDGELSEFDRSSLIAARRGREITNLWAAEDFFMVYTRGMPILCFSRLQRRDTGEDLLFFCDSQ